MAKQQTTSINKKAEMIYCERCGEDYSATYRRCPFCDERPGRRIDDRGARSPLQLAVLIVTLIIILAAAFIVFSKVAPLLKGPSVSTDPETPGVEQPAEPSNPAEPDAPVVPEIEVPDDVRAIADQRWEARKAKNWAESDRLREVLAGMGYAVLDSKDGYKLELK